MTICPIKYTELKVSYSLCVDELCVYWVAAGGGGWVGGLESGG